MTITCNTCEENIDCRIGYSNRLIQPIQFSCSHCHSPIEIILDTSESPRSKFKFNGCKPAQQQPDAPFNGDNPFVDLHLDFPVKFHKYVMGNTPWLASIDQLTVAADGDRAKAFEMYQFHTARLNALNQLYSKADSLKRIINLYHGKNKQLFQKRAAEFLEEDEEKSLLPQDLNATLYLVIAKAFFPFLIYEHGKEISEKIPMLLSTFDETALGSFIQEISKSGFLETLQKDCLKLYPRIFDAEIPLRPALFLDFIKSDESDVVAGRVSSSDFFSFKDLYKDILEVIGRQIIIIAGINNLYHRGDFNAFKTIDGGSLSSLQKLSEKTLSDKLKYLDDSYYNLSSNIFNFGLRNAIAHNNVQYNESTQVITYFPSGGRINKNESKNISFLEFMRLLLIAFREMHNLHHIVKSLFYYKFIIHESRQKDKRA
ncbi:hypothetical protein KJ965_05845 [Patescibacteria group bacterium]|nr:hypothetical protein [Gammaproteobacteria bacterium]MBU1932184.1 hypothetical protein [Patescibacteria group bacterium]